MGYASDLIQAFYVHRLRLRGSNGRCARLCRQVGAANTAGGRDPRSRVDGYRLRVAGHGGSPQPAAPQCYGLHTGRLYDTHHTAATVLLILGVPDTVVDAITGWEPGKSARMHCRYQHLTNRVLTDTADKIGGLLWPLPEEPPSG